MNYICHYCSAEFNDPEESNPRKDYVYNPHMQNCYEERDICDLICPECKSDAIEEVVQ